MGTREWSQVKTLNLGGSMPLLCVLQALADSLCALVFMLGLNLL